MFFIILQIYHTISDWSLVYFVNSARLYQFPQNYRLTVKQWWGNLNFTN